MLGVVNWRIYSLTCLNALPLIASALEIVRTHPHGTCSKGHFVRYLYPNRFLASACGLYHCGILYHYLSSYWAWVCSYGDITMKPLRVSAVYQACTLLTICWVALASSSYRPQGDHYPVCFTEFWLYGDYCLVFAFINPRMDIAMSVLKRAFL